MRPTQRKQTGCGNKNHESGCLCDVKLDAVIDPRDMPAMDDRLVVTAIRILQRTKPGRWSTLQLLEAIATVTEAARGRNHDGDDGTVTDKITRGIETHLSLGYSMSDTCQFFSRSLEEIVFIVSHGKPNKTWSWDLDEWDGFIDDIREMPHNDLNLLRLARKWGMSDKFTARWVNIVNPLYQPILGAQKKQDVAG